MNEKTMARSIKKDLNIGIGVILLTVSITVGYIYYFISTKIAEEDFNHFIVEQTNNIGETFALQLWLFDLNNIKKLGQVLLNSPQISGLILKDNNGELIFSGGTMDDMTAAKICRNLFYEGKNRVGYLEVYYFNSIWQEHEKDILYMGGGIIVGSILIFSFLINLLIQKLLSNPLDTLKKDITAISAGKFKLSTVSNQHTEVQDIIDAFNELVLRLEHRDGEILDKTLSLETEISEHKKTEIQLKESEKKYRTLFKSASDAYFMIDVETLAILDANETAVELYGYTHNELLKLKATDLFQDAETIRLPIKTHRKPPVLLKYHTKKNGVRFPVEITMTYVSLYGKRINISSIRDISPREKIEKEKKQLEFSLRQSQKMESIGTLAGGVAHEINNPINGIMNYAQLIKDRMREDHSLNEFADEIIHETNRVATIVRNLLTFAREETEHHSPARIKDILNAVLSLIQTIIRKDQIQIELKIPEGLPDIKCRSQQIQQVFMNLMTNARDALNDRYPGYNNNKKMIISSRLHEKDGRKWICTTVEDHGNGINPEFKDKIFDPFFTSKSRDVGTGLGLSIAYGIVKSHHGELSSESMVDSFTKFHVDLPVDNGWEIKQKDKKNHN